MTQSTQKNGSQISVLPTPAASQQVSDRPIAPVPLAAPPDDFFSWRRPKSLQLAMQMGLSIAVFLFCAGQIVARDMQRQDVSLYWGGIVSVLAWWMPSPNNNNVSNSEKKER